MFGGIWIFSILITVVVVGASIFFWVKVLGGMHKSAQEERRLLASGAPAMGQIIAANQTGTYINHQPQVMITVMVQPQGGQPYQAQLTKVISMMEMAQYQVGSQVHVRYDPQNPSKIAIITQQQAMMQNPMAMQQQMMQQPGMQQPGMQQPGMQQPGMQQPGMQQPGMQQPGMQQPGMQQPGMQQPGMQQPGMQQPGGYPQAPGGGGGGYPPAGGGQGGPSNFGA